MSGLVCSSLQPGIFSGRSPAAADRSPNVRSDSMGKKQKPRGPRRKRTSRAGRLQSARSSDWVANYSGKNIVRGYRKWFGVDLLCAVVELRELGVRISAEREEQLRESVASSAAARAERMQRRAEQERVGSRDSDDTFAFIAGYTSGGAPYGTTWEEVEQPPPPVESRDCDPAGPHESERLEDIPF